MNDSSILHQLQGPFNFLRTEPEELRQLVGDAPISLPHPQRIFLEDEVSTPLHGFPVLVSERLRSLRRALIQYITQEELLQLGIFRRAGTDRTAYNQAWESYSTQLCRAVENVTISSYGRRFPALFWLQHSLDLSALLKETPRRVTREDREIGKRHGDDIKYRVYDRYVDRIQSTVYDLMQRLASDTDAIEEELFPRLLTRMVDNVLILTEDYVSPNLAELNSYFAGHLHIDGRDLRGRLDQLAAWHREQLDNDRDLVLAIRHLLGADPERPRDLLVRPGYVTFLSGRPAWDAGRLLSPEAIKVWERLLIKLKEFELFHALRRMILPVEVDSSGEGYVTSRQSLNRTIVGHTDLRLSPTTRPMDFMAPWVVDPLVHRFGMIYDIADFSEVVSVLRRSGSDTQDSSFRRMFRFQRRINRLADDRRLKLEKYLGDGAFYSSRRGGMMLIAAVQIQRLYAQAVADGFPFDHGLRVALNFGQYRLIPIHTGAPGTERYEFFGHGLVELSRLTTGKATREIEEIKTMLVNLGYRQDVVHRFFAPVLTKNVDVIDKREEARTFYAYINRNGNLVNEGVVATGSFIDQLDAEHHFTELWRAHAHNRTWVAVELTDPAAGGRNGETLVIGLRRLGVASLKGLDKLAVFEVIDLGDLSTDRMTPMHGPGLMAAIEREASGRLQAQDVESTGTVPG